LYDFIVADLFELHQDQHGFNGQVFTHSLPSTLGPSLDSMITEAGFNIAEIRFIEGLLFISMLPLHFGNLKRQKILYLTGLTLLNEVL
ncbi:unnamed protein product, partial [marine sediment metagenome]